MGEIAAKDPDAGVAVFPPQLLKTLVLQVAPSHQALVYITAAHVVGFPLPEVPGDEWLRLKLHGGGEDTAARSF